MKPSKENAANDFTEKSDEAKRKDTSTSDYLRASGHKPASLYERTRVRVYASGNKWAIENFHATHD